MTGNDLLEKQKVREDIITEIHEKYADVDWPTPILEPLFYGRLKPQKVNDRKLMLDKKTGNQFDIVSNQYELMQHEEVLYKLINAIPEEFGKPIIKINLFKNGARANFTANFPELKQFKLPNGDSDVEYRLKNSYDRSSYLNYSAGVKELVCSNGLRVFKSKESKGAKHIGNTISSFQLEKRLKNSLETISESHKIWLEWANQKINKLEIQSIVEALPYSDNEQSALMELPLLNHNNSTLTNLMNKSNATVWSVFSASTQMVQEIKSEERKLNLEETLPNIIRKFAA